MAAVAVSVVTIARARAASLRDPTGRARLHLAVCTIETEILALEQRYWQAIQAKDVDAAMRLTDDVAIVAYQVREELIVDGQALTLDAADTSTWVRRDGVWRCALHTESILGDPFGRDRRA